MSQRFAISTATVIMLVALRLNVGWHFFSEGVAHYTEPGWTSAPTLRAAKGPLAPLYKSYLPDEFGLDRWLHESGQKPAAAVDGFVGDVQTEFDQERQRFALHYGLDEAQQKRASTITKDYQNEVRSWASANREDLVKHAHEWQRQANNAALPSAGDVPYQEDRLAAAKATLAGEAAGWRKQLAAIRSDFQDSLGDLVSAEQESAGALPPTPSSIGAVDSVMTYAILTIGGLLILGLFTRTACIAGAIFLFSVVMMQPFWVSAALPTYNQYVEMFALLTLATTRVGRWAGLDFFVHHFLFGSSARDERQTDVSQS